MSRTVVTGKYVIPPEIQALKPKDISCTIKAIPNPTKQGEARHYYVYENTYVPGEQPGKKKRVSVKVLGKIEGGRFVPNEYYQKLTRKTGQEKGTGNEKESSVLSGEERRIAELAGAMNLEPDEVDLQIGCYGEVAAVIASTLSVLRQLESFFHREDARQIYVMSLIFFLQEYVLSDSMQDLYEQSILSVRWPSLDLSEQGVRNYLKLLGPRLPRFLPYVQDVIHQGSGMTAIDGHVLLLPPNRKDTPDYGSMQQWIDDGSGWLLHAFDVQQQIPLASFACPDFRADPCTVEEFMRFHVFTAETCTLLDMDFYSEENMDLYREANRYFIIPVPENTEISRAFRMNIGFTDSFIYERQDAYGNPQRVPILYRESTVKELESLFQQVSDQNTDSGPAWTSSDFGEDRVIMYQDGELQHEMETAFWENSETDDQQTKEQLEKIRPFFGMMILRTNYTRTEADAATLYRRYKTRWTIKTRYRFVENTVQYCGLRREDYYELQGLSFLMVPFGQVQAAFEKQMRASGIGLSIGECLGIASKMKVAQHTDHEWRVNLVDKPCADLLAAMGVNVAQDLKMLRENSR